MYQYGTQHTVILPERKALKEVTFLIQGHCEELIRDNSRYEYEQPVISTITRCCKTIKKATW